jgi:type I protein arginine methyltransferase
VDIIISEWMGYFLLYESMLDCVLWARDKYLTPDGHLFPDRAVMYVSSIEDEEYRQSKIDFWDDVYGVDMNCIKKWALKEPLIDSVESKAINSLSCPILDINLKTVKVEELNFASHFQLKITRDDSVHAIIGW